MDKDLHRHGRAGVQNRLRGKTALRISYYNLKNQLTNQLDPDSVSTLYAYNPKGERTYTILDPSGADRITFVTNDVTVNNGANVRRTRTYVWSGSGNTSNLVSTTETSTAGLNTWNMIWNNGLAVTSQSATVYALNGYRYVTNTAPDNSYTLSTYRSRAVALGH